MAARERSFGKALDSSSRSDATGPRRGKAGQLHQSAIAIAVNQGKADYRSGCQVYAAYWSSALWHNSPDEVFRTEGFALPQPLTWSDPCP
jgi:hypothetical protein